MWLQGLRCSEAKLGLIQFSVKYDGDISSSENLKNNHLCILNQVFPFHARMSMGLWPMGGLLSHLVKFHMTPSWVSRSPVVGSVRSSQFKPAFLWRFSTQSVWFYCVRVFCVDDFVRQKPFRWTHVSPHLVHFPFSFNLSLGLASLSKSVAVNNYRNRSAANFDQMCQEQNDCFLYCLII